MTPYQTIQVRDALGVRPLSSDSFTHGGMNLATGQSALFYPRVATAALLLRPKIESMLVLGLGAGHAGTNMQRYLPGLEIDFVDIDPAMPEVAQRFFRFEPGPTRRVHVQDGRRFIDQAERSWDYIYCDTYIGLSVPFHLATREFLEQVREHLNPGGVFGLNLAGTYERPFPRAIYRTVREVFPHAWSFDVPTSGNLLLLAIADGPPPSAAELAERAAQLDATYGFEMPLREVLALQHRSTIDFTDTPVLSDVYAPVDRLLHLDAEKIELPR
jgi:spermidine synthase